MKNIARLSPEDDVLVTCRLAKVNASRNLPSGPRQSTRGVIESQRSLIGENCRGPVATLRAIDGHKNVTEIRGKYRCTDLLIEPDLDG